MSNIGEVPNRPAGTDVRSIAAILADFDYITNDYNGNIDANNIAASLMNTFLRLGDVGNHKVYFRTNLDPAVGFDSVAGRSRARWTYVHGLAVDPIFVLPTMRPIAIQEDANSRSPVLCVESHSNVNIVLVATVNGTTNNGAPYDLLIVT